MKPFEEEKWKAASRRKINLVGDGKELIGETEIEHIDETGKEFMEETRNEFLKDYEME